MAAVTSDDYYAVLGIAANVDSAELRRVWHRLALQWHPDHAGPGATTTFQKMSIAYAVLSDPVARAAYDRWRDTAVRSSPAASDDATSAPAATTNRRAPGVLLSRLSGPLNALLARGVASHAEDDVIELWLEAEEAEQGGMVTISMRVPVRCPWCNGDPAMPCPNCSGERSIEDLFSAWLAVRPGVADGAILTPSAWLPGMVRPVYFRVRLGNVAGS
jgi:molecular chaperone DnaJ